MYNVFQLAYSTETLKKNTLKNKTPKNFFQNSTPKNSQKTTKYQKNSNYATFKFFFLVFEHSFLPKLLIRLIQKWGVKMHITLENGSQKNKNNDPLEVLSSSS